MGLSVAPWAYPVIDEYPNYSKACLRGGRGRGASHTLARLVIKAMLQYGHNVLVGREHQTSIKQSNINLIKRVIRESEYAGDFDLNKVNIIRCKSTGAVCEFKGIRLSLDDWRSLDDYQLIWFEEPHMITDDQLDVIMPSLREDNITLVASWNPLFEDSPVERLRNYPNTLDLFATYEDNPYFTAVLEEERKVAFDTRPLDVYQWIWEGRYKQVGLSNPFGAKAISAAINREWIPIPKGEYESDTLAGVDVADTLDGDYTAVVSMDVAGNVLKANHFRIEDPDDRHAAVYELVKDIYYVLVDCTESAGRQLASYLRKRGKNVRAMVFTRERKRQWVTYAARRLQEERGTLRDCPELVHEIKLFSHVRKNTSDPIGKYEASVGHDDLVCAWLLAYEGLRQWNR